MSGCHIDNTLINIHDTPYILPLRSLLMVCNNPQTGVIEETHNESNPIKN